MDRQFSEMTPYLTKILDVVGKLAGDNTTRSKRTTFKTECERHKHRHRFDGEKYPKEISRRMLTTSYMLSIPAAFSIYYQCYFLAVGMWMVTLCSINYWRKPVDGMRHLIDVCVARAVVLIHFLYGIAYVDRATAVVVALQILGCGIFHILSRICHRNECLNLNCCFHCSMHIWVIFCNWWVYYKIWLQRI